MARLSKTNERWIVEHAGVLENSSPNKIPRSSGNLSGWLLIYALNLAW